MKCLECDKPVWARQMCKSHYDKWLKLKNPAYAKAQLANSNRWQAQNKERVRDYKLKYRQFNKDNLKESDRRSKLLRVYGITQEDYEVLYKNQKGCCGICGSLSNLLAIDHDHHTNKIRGLLCRPCNLAIGLLGDTLEGVEKAVNYLRAS